MWTFLKAAREIGFKPSTVGQQASNAQDLSDHLRVFVDRSPFTGHLGYAGGMLHDAAMDIWDWVREILAILYYWIKGYI